MTDPTVADAERTEDENIEAFVEILKHGGTLILHPDTWARMLRHRGELSAVLDAHAIRVVPNDACPRDRLFAATMEIPLRFDTWPKVQP